MGSFLALYVRDSMTAYPPVSLMLIFVVIFHRTTKGKLDIRGEEGKLSNF